MSCKVQKSVCSDFVTYVKSRIKFNTFNTFNNVKKNFLMKMKHSMMAICTVVAAGMMTASLAACSSEDECEKNAAKVKEYLAGNEWTINSTRGTYSYYKNHMVYYEEGGDVTPGGFVIEPNTAFGYWQMDGDKLTTRFEVGTPKSFNIKNLLNETISGVHLQESNKLTGSRVSISIDMRPLIVGTFAGGGECKMRCGNSLNDISDETDHDVALRGTWYCVIALTDMESGKKEQRIGSMTFNEDGTMHMVIEGYNDFTTTYTTKNGKVTIQGYLFKDHVATFYYTNHYSFINLYNCENGYLSSIWRKNRNEAWQ